ncbi:MAG: hypothetical protein AAGF20_00835 [Pseudomonadota bacterium]
MAKLTKHEKKNFAALGDEVRLHVAVGVVAQLYDVGDRTLLLKWQARVSAPVQDARDALAHLLNRIGFSYSQLARRFDRTERAMMYAVSRSRKAIDGCDDERLCFLQAVDDVVAVLRVSTASPGSHLINQEVAA